MDRDKLKNDLKELKAEIINLEDKDPQIVGRLRDIAESIERALDESSVSNPSDDLIQGLQGNIEHFEAEHPTLTGILDRITKALSSMGI